MGWRGRIRCRTGRVKLTHYPTISWRPNGYKAYDYNSWDHNVLTESTWSVPGVPGYFWNYVRSPLFPHHQARSGRSLPLRLVTEISW